MKTLIVIPTVVLLLAVAANAQTSPAVTGSWLGTLDVKVAKLRIQLNIKKTKNGEFKGGMVSLDQSPVEIAFDRITVKEDVFEFEIKNLKVVFKGKISGKGTVITGEFNQMGQAFPLEFKKMDKPVVKKLTEVWQGKMKAGAQQFDFQFRVYKDADGRKTVELDSFSEKITVPGEMEQKDSDVTISIPATKAKYVGKLDEKKEVIIGSWKQSGGEFPLNLKKVKLDEVREITRNRPQTPKPPFEYQARDFEVRISDMKESFDSETVLAGTLTTPNGEGPFPTLIMISGSGPQDRDEQIFGHRPFFVYADHLAQHGYAVIRFDDRGIAKSKGNFATATSADFADDVEALLLWASKQAELDSKKLILCGHSEGGLIAPMVAARNQSVAGIVMLAGPGVSGEKIILNQTRKIAATAGATEGVLDMQEQMLTAIFGRLKSDLAPDDEFKTELKDSLKKEFEGVAGLEAILAAVDRSVVQFAVPWMKYFISYEPSTSLTKTVCPVFAVVGSNDLQVDPELNQPAIEEALKKAGNKDVTLTVLPKLNHLFQTSETGAPSEYNVLEETVSPVVLDAVTEWLDARFK